MHFIRMLCPKEAADSIKYDDHAFYYCKNLLPTGWLEIRVWGVVTSSEVTKTQIGISVMSTKLFKSIKGWIKSPSTATITQAVT